MTVKLHQVFLNIIANAEQAISDEGVITISTSQQDDKIIVNFEDNGKGIKDDILSKVNDPFFTTKEPGEGTGLGLAIAESIIREHEGTLSIQSEYGRGTVVTVTLIGEGY